MSAWLLKFSSPLSVNLNQSILKLDYKLLLTAPSGAHLGGEKGGASSALKKKSVSEQAICPENAL